MTRPVLSNCTCCSQGLNQFLVLNVTGTGLPRITSQISVIDLVPSLIEKETLEASIVQSVTYLCIIVTVFKELLARPAEEKKNGAPHLPKIGDIKKASRYSIPDLAVDVEQVIGLDKANKKAKANTVGGRNKLKKILDKTRISILPQKPYRYVSALSTYVLCIRPTMSCPNCLHTNTSSITIKHSVLMHLEVHFYLDKLKTLKN